MLRNLRALLFAMLLVVVARVPAANAQESEDNTRRIPTLADRLGQFRKDLMGDSESKRRRASQPSDRKDAPWNEEERAWREKREKAADQWNRERSQDEMQNSERGNQRSTSEKSRSQDRSPRTASELRSVPSGSKREPKIVAMKPGQRLSGSQSASADDDGDDAAFHTARRAEPSPVAAATTTAARSRSTKSLQDRLRAARSADASTKPSSSKSRASEQPAKAARAERIANSRVEREVAPVEPVAPPVASRKIPAQAAVGTTKRPAGENVLFSGQSPMINVEATGPKRVMVGKEAEFSVKVRNAGDSPANNVVIAINIPQYADVVHHHATAGAMRPPGGTDHVEPFEWRLPRLEARSRELLTLRLVPRKSNPLDLAVQWSCSPETSQTLVEVQEAKLTMAIAGPGEVLYGQSKIYKLTISNPGNGDAENVHVSLLPIGRGAEGTASHHLGDVAAGDSKIIELELTARQVGALSIKAQAFADGGLRAEVIEQVLVRRANLQAQIEGPKVKYAGTVGTYLIRVVNNGNATADNVEVAALLPPQAKYVASNGGGRLEQDAARVTWAAGTLQPGAERIYEMRCMLLAAGENLMQTTVSADDDLTATVNITTRVEALADLKLEVRDAQGPIPIGENTVYEVVLRNRGTKAAEGIDLIVFFSEGLEATAVQGGAHDIGRGQVAFKRINVLGAGAESIYRIHCRAEKPGNHVFRAEVVCPTLQTKLAAEETTHFYGDDTVELEAKAAADGPHPALSPAPPLEGASSAPVEPSLNPAPSLDPAAAN